MTESTALPSDSRDHLQPTTASLIAAVQAHMGRHLCPHLLLWLRADLAKRLPSLLWGLLMVPCRRPRWLGSLRWSLRCICGVPPAAVCGLPGSRCRRTCPCSGRSGLRVARLCTCAVTGGRSRLQWGRLCQGTITGSRGTLQEGRLW